jgi:hypothetical protein
MLVSTMFGQRDKAVRRGYRLHVTNLEDRTFTYSVRYWVTPPNDLPHWASTLNQFFLHFAGLYGDSASIDVPVFFRTGSVYVASTSFQVEPNHTVSVGINPTEGEVLSGDVDLLEGYVTLELPVLRDGNSDSPFRSQPQANGPVKVLLNPETTMIHRDTSGPGYTLNMDGIVTGRAPVTRLNFDTVEPLIPASGKAENELTPNGILLLSHDALVDAVKTSQAAEARSFVGTENLPVADRMGALIELLCELDTQEKFLVELNKVLVKNHAAARICRREGKER